MKIVVLGSGSPHPSLSRMSSGYLVDLGGEVLVFDHGPGAHHRLLEAGYKATDVDRFFLSHLHYDHHMDYARLVLTRWDKSDGIQPELKVHAPAPFDRINNQLFGKSGVWDEDLEARTQHPMSIAMYLENGGVPPRKRPSPDLQIFEDGEVIEGDGWKVTIREVWHAQPHMKCYGFRLETEDGVFTYLGDTGLCDNVYPLAQDADVVVGMCAYDSHKPVAHSDNEGCTGHLELAHIGSNAKAKTLVMSHIANRLDTPETLERLAREIRTQFDGNVVIGEDLLELQVRKNGK